MNEEDIDLSPGFASQELVNFFGSLFYLQDLKMTVTPFPMPKDYLGS